MGEPIMERPIRILQVCGIMNRGGIETMLMNLFRRIDRNQIVFDFMVHSEEEGEYDEEIKALGGNIYNVPSYNGKNHFSYKKKWNKFFEEHKEYAIVHGHVRSTAGIYLKIAKEHGCVTIFHSHNTKTSGHGIEVLVKEFWQYRGRYYTDYFFACGQEAGEWLFGKKIVSGKRFYLVKNAIDVEKFAYDSKKREQLRKEMGLTEKYVVGNVGSFTTQKNHDFLLKAFREARNLRENAVLYLVGQGPLKEEIVKSIADLGLQDDVILAGTTSSVQDAYLIMDVFAFPSLHEGLPLVLIEAQATGVPCVVSKDRVTPEVKVTNSIEFLSLDEGVKVWGSRVLEVEARGRKSHLKEVVDAGYDVEQTALWLRGFYLKIAEGTKM